MRIIRGKLKSRTLFVPKGFDSRPTTNFSKEALFNILDNRLDLKGMEVLDLCSGTGNISLEFVSSDVKHVWAVDKNFKCIKFLQSFAKQLDIEDEITVHKSDVIKFLETVDKKFDLIFADPPFEVNMHENILRLIFERNLLKEDGLVVIEHGKKTNLESLPHFDFTRKYGAVHFSFFQKA